MLLNFISVQLYPGCAVLSDSVTILIGLLPTVAASSLGMS